MSTNILVQNNHGECNCVSCIDRNRVRWQVRFALYRLLASSVFKIHAIPSLSIWSNLRITAARDDLHVKIHTANKWVEYGNNQAGIGDCVDSSPP